MPIAGGLHHLLTHFPAAEVIKVAVDPDAHCASTDQVVADAVAVADDEDAELAGPGGPTALPVP